jgi:hybrid polyketide synthase/nonribosomal peptide synthetase FtdB
MKKIAIVGMGCRFPGGADNIEKFWEVIKNGIDATSDVPGDRWDIERFYDPDKSKPGKTHTMHGGFLDNIDQFDASFFGISPREADFLDPQQRVLLEIAWEAMEDAGLIPKQLAGKDVGVFIGAFVLDYKIIQFKEGNIKRIDSHTATGSMMTMVSNRISYIFDFHGPSMSIDTACSSSMVALHTACQSILNGECSLALAGGVNLTITPEYTISESKGGFLAPDGRCKTWDAGANGYARGEGAGIIVLKPLDKALEDGDLIYGVIRGSGVNQDGHTRGITVPNGEAQEALMRQVYKNAGVSPGQVQYVEAHGTGTPVGDPIEVNTIAKVMKQGRAKGSKCIIGSVKTNIGHLEAASGIAGMIKAALILKHRKIPPHLHFVNPNPKIAFDQLCVRVPTTLEEWPQNSGPALIGVNSFGFGGTNAHVLLEAPPKPQPEPGAAELIAGKTLLFPFSARSEASLKMYIERMIEFLQNREINLKDLVYTTWKRRSHHNERLTVAAATQAELTESLQAYLEDQVRPGMAKGRSESETARGIVFVYTGMGPIWWAMGRELLETETVFREVIQKCDGLVQKDGGWSLLEELTKSEQDSRLDQPRYAQPANFAVQVALTKLWESWGIVPEAVVGHSVGEVAAAYAAGIYTLEDAVRVSVQRSLIQQKTVNQGTMLAVGMSASGIRDVLKDFTAGISLAALNSPTSVTLSGERAELERLQQYLQGRDIFARFLKVNVPYHSHVVDPYHDELLCCLKNIHPQKARLKIYSTTTGQKGSGAEYDGGYWWQNVRNAVHFEEAMDEIIKEGYTLFIQVGPHPALTANIKECLAKHQAKGRNFPSLKRKEAERLTMLETLGGLYSSGYPVEFAPVYSLKGNFVRLPLYAWEHERYWYESETERERRLGGNKHPVLGYHVNAQLPTWERELSLSFAPYLADHRISGSEVFPGAGYVEMGMACARAVFGEGGYALEAIKFEKALFLKKSTNVEVRTVVHPEEAIFAISSRYVSLEATSDWVANASGRIVKRRLTAKLPENLSFAAIRERCVQPVAQKRCYEVFDSMGFNYGTGFRGIAMLWKGSNEALAKIVPPAHVDVADCESGLHPSILDSCFQVLIGVVAGLSEGDEQENRAFLPVGIDRFQVYQRPQAEMWCYGRTVESSDQLLRGDLFLLDGAGNLIAEISNFTCGFLESSAVSAPHDPDQWLYETEWRRSAARAVAGRKSNYTENGTFIVIADQKGVGYSLAQELKQTGKNVIVVFGEQSSSKAIPDYRLTPGDYTQVAQLLETVRQTAPINAIIHLWSLDALEEKTLDAAALERINQAGCITLKHIVQVIEAKEIKPKLWIVTRGAQLMNAETPEQSVAQASVWGVGRVIGHQEFPSCWGGLVDLDVKEDSAEIARLCREIGAPDQEDQIAYRAGQRYALRVVKRKMASSLTLPHKFYRNGSYLVTGAFGALGMLTARWMVEKGVRNIILLGRVAFPQRDEWKKIASSSPLYARIAFVKELEALGARVHIATVDLNHSAEIREFIAWYQANEWPGIRGVIHSAGVVKDSLLSKMDDQTFSAVLHPKVIGTWNLHQAFAAMELDFFVMYSSIGSLLVSLGQGNYAAGNAFIDALSEYRKYKGLPTLSINWGPWGEVGMAAKLNLTEHYRQQGIDSILPTQGVRILERLMASEGAQTAVIPVLSWSLLCERHYASGNAPAIVSALAEAEQLAGKEEKIGCRPDANLLKEIITTGETERQVLVKNHLVNLIAKVMRFEPSKLDPGQALISLGMDSMMATEIRNRVEQRFETTLSVVDLLQGASIEELALKLLQNMDAAGKFQPAQTPTETVITDAPSLMVVIPRIAQTKYCELSAAQKRMYVLNEIEAAQTNYNVPFVEVVAGKIDVVKLENAIKTIISRHESLRSSFGLKDERPMVEVHSQVDFQLETIDAGGASPESLNRLIASLIKPFDLSKAPLLRVALLKIAAQKQLLFLDVHHIICDATSMYIFARELAKLYSGEELSELPIQYRDFAAWQKNSFKTAKFANQENYWLNQFQGELPVLNMSYDFPRPLLQSYEGNRRWFKVETGVYESLKTFCKETGTTFFMVLLAAYNVLLYKYTGQEEIIVGSPIEGRTHRDLESLIGIFINTLPLRNFPGRTKSFKAFLQEVRETSLQAYENQEYPFEKLVEKIDPPRDMSRNPLFDTMFSLQSKDDFSLELEGIKMYSYKFDNFTAKFDLMLEVSEVGNEMSYMVEYCTKLFTAETIERFGKHYLNVLKAVSGDPEIQLAKINILSQEEQQQLIFDFNNTAHEFDRAKTVPYYVEAHAKATPERIAVIYGESQATYGEVNRKANQIAHALVATGSGKNEVIAVLLDRSVLLVESILGIWKAGAVYLPLDPQYPTSRIETILNESGVGQVLTLPQYTAKLENYGGKVINPEAETIKKESEEDLNFEIDSGNMAYVIYTSGSTGIPKGAMIEHVGMMNHIHAEIDLLGLTAATIMAQNASHCFDISVWQFFAALTVGGRIVIYSNEVVTDVCQFTDRIKADGITILEAVPSFLGMMLEYLKEQEMRLEKLDYLLATGETVKPELVRKWLALNPGTKVVNAYGPAEASDDITQYIVEAAPTLERESLPIGKPLPNMHIYIVDQDLNLCPLGVQGEICVSGIGVGRGYLNDPEKTDRVFMEDPFRSETGIRLYKTGDLGRWLPDGCLEFLGRIDHQVKLRGFRIELGEIENRLMKAEAVDEAVVLAKEDASGDKYLCAYIVAKREIGLIEMREYLSRHLPDYMVPTYLVQLAKLPVTPNGKIDRKALPEPEENMQTGMGYLAPRNLLEQTLVEVWQSVLGTPKMGIRDNYFVLGGDSIKAIQIAARLQSRGWKLNLKELFRHPTIEALSCYLTKVTRRADQGAVEGRVLLTPIQKWFFAQTFFKPHHYNQSMMLFRQDGYNEAILRQVFDQLVVHHDALRMSYQITANEMMQFNRGLQAANIYTLDSFVVQDAEVAVKVREIANQIQGSLDLGNGPLMRLGLFHTKNGDHLLIVIHHLVVDGISWRILLEDLMTAYEQVSQGKEVTLPLKSHSFREWAAQQFEYAQSKAVQSEIDYWRSFEAIKIASLPRDFKIQTNQVRDSRNLMLSLSESETETLLKQVNQTYHTEINDILLTALGRAFQEWTGEKRILINLEGHGRESISEDLDISRTIGWFTSEFPVVLDLTKAKDLADQIKAVKQSLRRIPNKGVGYGILKYLTAPELKQELSFSLKPEISFNYLGRFDQQEKVELFGASPLSGGREISEANARTIALDINGVVTEGQLHLMLSYNMHEYASSTMERFFESYRRNLLKLIEHCLTKETTEFTPDDFGDKDLSLEDLQNIADCIE